MGHNVTVLAPDKDESTIPGLHFIWAEKVYEAMNPAEVNTNDQLVMSANPFSIITQVWPASLPMCVALFASDGFKQILNYPSDFQVDLLIADTTIGPCWTGFMHKFNYPPLIGLTAFEIPDYIYDYMDGHSQQAYIPHQTVGYTNKMTFLSDLPTFT